MLYDLHELQQIFSEARARAVVLRVEYERNGRRVIVIGTVERVGRHRACARMTDLASGHYAQVPYRDVRLVRRLAAPGRMAA